MKTGFYDLDKMIDINGPKVIILGSRPGIGKSTLALNIISNIAIKQGKNILYFNLESSKYQIEDRFIISNGMINYEKYYKAKESEIEQQLLSEEEKDRIKYGKELLKTSRIFIEDKAKISVEEICAKARKLKQEQNLQLVVIDYLQLIDYKNNEKLNIEQKLNEILKKLNLLSKELNIPILITSELSSRENSKVNNIPNISDFSLSKLGINKYSDIVLLLHRNECNNIAKIIIEKNSLETGTIEIAWIPEYCKFGNLLKINKLTGI